MKLSRIRRGEWIAGGGSAVLLLSMLLLPWFHSLDGWHGLSHGRWLLLATVVSGLALVLLQAGRAAPAIPVTLSVFVEILGGLSALWLIYRVLISPPGDSRQVGGFIALIGACAIAYGGYASARQEGIAEADAPADIPIVDPGAASGS